jgi:hypothetical protein
MLLLLLMASLLAPLQSNCPTDPSYATTDESVVFEVKLQRGPANLKQTTVWAATHKAKGHTAIFRIELQGTSKGPNKPILLSFGKGRFIAQPGSDAAALIAALKKALQAKRIPAKPKRVNELPFEYALLGLGGHREPDGSFSAQKKGHWITMKLFFGGDEGEVFLNLNPVSGKGEFSIKDSDYGDYVVGKLAQVL